MARWQLLEAGISDDQIRWRLRKGLLIARLRGVYACGHDAPTAHSLEIEALLTRGPGTLICAHRAAGLYGFRPMCAGVDLLVPDTRGAGHREDIRIHRTGRAEHLKPHFVEGIPVVAPEYALLEIAADLGERALEVALDEAFETGRVNRDDVRRVVRANPTAAGAGLLTELLGRRLVGNRTRSEGQEKLLALVRASGLPEPKMDASIGGGFTIDMYWPEARVGTEYDSFKWHRARSKWARDRRKSEYCEEHGIELVRVIDENLRGTEPLKLTAKLAMLIASRRDRD